MEGTDLNILTVAGRMLSILGWFVQGEWSRRNCKMFGLIFLVLECVGHSSERWWGEEDWWVGGGKGIIIYPWTFTCLLTHLGSGETGWYLAHKFISKRFITYFINTLNYSKFSFRVKR